MNETKLRNKMRYAARRAARKAVASRSGRRTRRTKDAGKVMMRQQELLMAVTSDIGGRYDAFLDAIATHLKDLNPDKEKEVEKAIKTINGVGFPKKFGELIEAIKDLEAGKINDIIKKHNLTNDLW